ncbi:YoaK family protein [Saccharopolyspora shandongensis]|uniref:YoaK family protein n=1 Tax=Saccharopolyspora shandongensis TaxID=418495 RepID=UPI0034107AF3
MLRFGGVFVSVITGNLVVLAAFAVRGLAGPALNALTSVGAYALGVFAGSRIEARLAPQPGRPPAWPWRRSYRRRSSSPGLPTSIRRTAGRNRRCSCWPVRRWDCRALWYGGLADRSVHHLPDRCPHPNRPVPSASLPGHDASTGCKFWPGAETVLMRYLP